MNNNIASDTFATRPYTPLLYAGLGGRALIKVVGGLMALSVLVGRCKTDGGELIVGARLVIGFVDGEWVMNSSKTVVRVNDSSMSHRDNSVW